MSRAHKSLVLSIYPTSRGFSFVIFEGSTTLYDWGVKDVRGKDKNERSMQHIRAIIDSTRPDCLVIEDYRSPGSRRSPRIRSLYRQIAHYAGSGYIDVELVSKQTVRQCFSASGVSTKYGIARAIAREIPAIAHRLPKYRKIWMSEDPRQSLFDAAALGMAYYAARDVHVRSCT